MKVSQAALIAVDTITQLPSSAREWEAHLSDSR